MCVGVLVRGRERVTNWVVFILSVLKGLGEVEEDETASSWVERMKAKEEEKKMAQERVLVCVCACVCVCVCVCVPACMCACVNVYVSSVGPYAGGNG